MKVSKKQLKRIIREEKRKLVKEQHGGDYSTGRWNGLEERLDTVLYELQQMFVDVNGMHEIEAAEAVLDECARTLGVVR